MTPIAAALVEEARRVAPQLEEDAPVRPTSKKCMEQRIRMLLEHDTGNWSVSELCRRYGVCRDTFYEWRRGRPQ
jgi:hypothetical protein